MHEKRTPASLGAAAGENERSCLTALCVATALGIALFSAPAVGAEPVVVFSATGDATTAPFRVEDAWEVRWDAEGRRFELVLKGTPEEIPSILANQIEPGGGSRQYVRGGSYYFEVRANGAWRVEVRQRVTQTR